MKPTPRIDLLLIGRTGNGKSATGNTLLREKKFTSKSSTSSRTKQMDYGITEFKGRKIKVVDGLTISDTRLDEEGSVEQLNEAAKLALAVNPEGYHAFLLVLKYGNRFTREEQETVQVLKKIFGENFVRDYCILIITCGDIFWAKQDAKGGDGITFSQWLKKQDGAFKDLYLECNRAVMFDNSCDSELDYDDHIEALLARVDEIFCSRRYNLTHKVQLTNDSVLSDQPGPSVTSETMKEVGTSLAQMHIAHNSTQPENVTLCDMFLRQTKVVEGLVAQQEQFLVALRDLTQAVDTLQKKVSDESSPSLSSVDEIKQRRSSGEATQERNQKEEIDNENDDVKHDMGDFNRAEEKKFEDTLKKRKLERAKGILEKVERIRGCGKQFHNIRASQFRWDF
ncbi:uncharacterized protein LOC131943636 isoform X2 [Physella acuta]|nr:uncharacterized protein LOC131943636 isoform X2 [Physella acuta]XP_059159823.1 uncharacterized protein LOC131943636 isoform X2 [Physella acuta]